MTILVDATLICFGLAGAAYLMDRARRKHKEQRPFNGHCWHPRPKVDGLYDCCWCKLEYDLEELHPIEGHGPYAPPAIQKLPPQELCAGRMPKLNHPDACDHKGCLLEDDLGRMVCTRCCVRKLDDSTEHIMRSEYGALCDPMMHYPEAAE